MKANHAEWGWRGEKLQRAWVLRDAPKPRAEPLPSSGTTRKQTCACHDYILYCLGCVCVCVVCARYCPACSDPICILFHPPLCLRYLANREPWQKTRKGRIMTLRLFMLLALYLQGHFGLAQGYYSCQGCLFSIPLSARGSSNICHPSSLWALSGGHSIAAIPGSLHFPLWYSYTSPIPF